MATNPQNVGRFERVVRIIGGGLLGALGLTLLFNTGSFWVAGVSVVLVTLGADFLVTGVTGRCPLYRWLGWSTARPHTPMKMSQ